MRLGWLGTWLGIACALGCPEFATCIRELSVAEERGFCMGLGPGQSCPGALSSYVDVCEAMNR